jgi:hypothetical protein
MAERLAKTMNGEDYQRLAAQYMENLSRINSEMSKYRQKTRTKLFSINKQWDQKKEEY